MLRERNYIPKPKPLTPCGYCFSRWATGFDHLVPKLAGGSDLPVNLYPCCNRCNNLLSSKVFNTLDEKRQYVSEKLEGKDKRMRRMRTDFYGKTPMAEVLRENLQVVVMEQESPEKIRRKAIIAEIKQELPLLKRKLELLSDKVNRL